MYLDYYNLKINPFPSDNGNAIFWPGGNLSEIFSTLKEAIMGKKGIIFLVGAEGSGISTILKMITDTYQKKFIIASFSNPGVTGLDFFNILSVKFGFNREFKSKRAFLVHLRNFLRNSSSISKDLLLVMHVADRLKPEFFEDLALLSDIELNGRKRIAILLVGRSGWVNKWIHNEAKMVSDKVAVECSLKPLSKADTAEYINQCLKAAGTKQPIFSGKAIHEIFSLSRGNLKLINSICDLSLRKGYSTGKKIINAATVKKCRNELREDPIINGDVNPQNRFASSYTVSSRKWFWLKAFIVIVFLFSSYLLYVLQTKDTKKWRADDIAQKEYDFYKIREKEPISIENPPENLENPTGAKADARQAKTNSTNNLRKDYAVSTTDGKKNSVSSSNINKDWPFPTFKKIIYFKHNSNTLPSDSLKMLDKIAEYAINNPEREFIIIGFTDATGAESYNLTISKYRADSVRNYLIAKGMDPAKLDTSGLGSQDPIASNATAWGRNLNRRVEIELKLE